MALPVNLTQVADALVAPRGAPGSLARLRGRATAITLLVSVGAALGTVPVYASVGLWATAVLTGAFGGCVGVLLGLFRWGLPRTTIYGALSVCTAIYLGASSLVEQPMDFSALTWTMIIPLAGVLLVGVRGSLGGALIAISAGGFMLLAKSEHWNFRIQETVPPSVEVVRYAVLLGTIFALTVALELMRDQAMAEAERSSRARSLFLANMSHELRTPMNGVIGLTELVLGTPLQPDQREKLELAKRSGQALVTIIDDILNLTRLESGSLKLETLPTSPGALAEDVAQLHQGLLGERELTLTCALDDTVPGAAMLDPTRVRQVLTNLVGNALKFTESGNITLHVWTSGLPERLNFAVHDTGIGIPDEAMSRLFRPFAQVDETYTRRFGGTGLGLAISRELARAMGGELTATSERDVGSVFTLSLPLVRTSETPVSLAPASSISGVRRAAAPCPPPPPAAPAQPSPEVSRACVLVVDDNAINLRVAGGLVERLGYQVVTACNGREALELASAQDFLCILMDCHMPEMDGFEATRRLRALEGERARVPIIAVTASVMSEDVAACHAAGMNDCLPKPVNPEALQRLLAQFARRAAA